MSTSGTGSLLPSPMIVNQGNPYINGMRLTFVTATTFTVGAGQSRDSTNTMDILMGAKMVQSSGAGGTNSLSDSAAVTVSTAVSGAGGLDVGTLTTSTLYYVHAIGDSRGFNAGSALISLSLTAPSLPLGYDSFRRVGALTTYTDTTTKIRPFFQTGAGLIKTMWYDSLTLDSTHIGIAIPSSATAASQTLATIGVLTTIVPQVALEVMIYGSLVANAAGDSLLLTPKGFTGPATGFRTNASGTVVGEVMRVPANFNAGSPNIVEIDYATSSATATVAFTCPGYVDQL